jgi:phage-related protein
MNSGVVILDVFDKKTQATPARVIAACRTRAAAYDRAIGRSDS